jgi:hypothetical protein
LPKKYRKRLTPECFAELEQIRKKTYERKRSPHSREISPKARHMFQDRGVSIWDALNAIGINIADMPRKKPELKKKTPPGHPPQERHVAETTLDLAQGSWEYAEKYKTKLTDAELEFRLGILSKEDLRHVFLYLRADELGEYQPGKRDARAARERLCEPFESEEVADQILEYYAAAETRRSILPGAEGDARFAEASQAIRGRTLAPLMAEVPEEDAYTMWAIAGSWNGALELCGLDPLDDDARREAVTRYAIANASPELMPQEYRERLTPECVAELEPICKATRELRRYPRTREVSHKARHMFKDRGVVMWDVLESIGIYAIGAPNSKTRTKMSK